MLNDCIEYIKSLSIESIEGNRNPLTAYGILKQLELIIKESLNSVKESAINEASRFPKKRFCTHGFRFELSERKEWDYSHIQEWKEANKKLKDIEENSKIAAISNLDINGTTGEIIEHATYKTITMLKYLK